MRKNKHMNIILTFLMFVLMIQNVIAATPIDINKSTVEWLGTKVTGQHNGTLSLKEGSVNSERGAFKGGRFVFDMNSIKVLDIDDEKWNLKLENHLKSEDFFGVEKHPLAVFEIISATPQKGSNNYEIKGDLAIKGITHVVTFNAQVDIHGSASHAWGKITVDRTLYDIRYKSGKFFENLGDKTIYDDFIITFNVVTQ